MCASTFISTNRLKDMARREAVCTSAGSGWMVGCWGLRNKSFDQQQLQGKVNNEEVEQMKSYRLVCLACAAMCLEGKRILTFR